MSLLPMPATAPPATADVFSWKLQFENQARESSTEAPPPTLPSARLPSKRQSRAKVTSDETSEMPPPLTPWFLRKFTRVSWSLESLALSPLPLCSEKSVSEIWIIALCHAAP